MGDPIVGQPLCGQCYDYFGHVPFTWHLPELWRRFTIALRRAVAARLRAHAGMDRGSHEEFVKVVELQARAVPHPMPLIPPRPPSAPTTHSDQNHYGPAATCGGGEPCSDAGHRGWVSPITAGKLAALIQSAARQFRKPTFSPPMARYASCGSAPRSTPNRSAAKHWQNRSARRRQLACRRAAWRVYPQIRHQIPAGLRYHRPATLDEAIATLDVTGTRPVDLDHHHRTRRTC